MQNKAGQDNTAKSIYAVSNNYPVGATGKSIPDAQQQEMKKGTPAAAALPPKED